MSEKTTNLIAACCHCGAISAVDYPDNHKRMEEIGLKIGIAFQIMDDLFDYGLKDVGKPRRNDIIERKVTLPLIRALEGAPGTERLRISRLMRKRRKSRSEEHTSERQSRGQP